MWDGKTIEVSYHDDLEQMGDATLAHYHSPTAEEIDESGWLEAVRRGIEDAGLRMVGEPVETPTPARCTLGCGGRIARHLYIPVMLVD